MDVQGHPEQPDQHPAPGGAETGAGPAGPAPSGGWHTSDAHAGDAHAGAPQAGASFAEQGPTGWPTVPHQPPAAAGSPLGHPGVAAPPQPPHGGPAFGSPYGEPSPFGESFGEPAAAPAGPQQHSRLRVGIAGLVVGALIGGGAGAGVATLVADSATPRSVASGPAQNVVITNPEKATTATAAAAKAARSVVTIYVTNNSNAGSGSGIVLSPDGYVLTNNHVVTLESSGTGTVQVRTSDGTLYDASVVGTDPSSDLAVVKLKGAGGLAPATFADSDKVQVGDEAVAIGAPLGLSNTVTDGIISATGRAVATGSSQSNGTVIDALQTDAAINPGNSGGALLNGAGEVVGINTAIATVASEGQGSQSSQSGNIGVGFAIPSNTAKRVAEEIIKTGKASHAVLGVQARTVSSGDNPDAGNGAQIVEVAPDGAAAKAGLQTGDVITAVGKRPITTSVELTAAIRSAAPGSDVVLTVRRGNSSQTVHVTLGSTTS